MKKIQLSLFFSLVVLAASSQKVYFFYIQTESNQPFYVKMDKKVQHSSPNGYLILPRLYDSSYKITIGSPQNKWPEQQYVLNVNKKDHGFVLKNVPDKGWALYDLQSFEFMMASTDQKKEENGNVTAFTEILSKAAGDPSLKEKTTQAKPEEKTPEPVVVEEPAKTIVPAQSDVVVETDKPSKKAKRKSKKENEAVNEVKPEQTTAVIVDTVAKEEPKTEMKEEVKAPAKEEIKAPVKEEVKAEAIPEKKEEVKPLTEPVTRPLTEVPAKESELDNYKKSQVKRYAESSTTEGFGLVFVDQYENGKKDTIRLVIPNPKPVIDKITEAPKEEKKFLEISSVPADEKTVPEKTVAEQPKEKKKEEAIVKKNLPNGCSNAASDNDLSKLNRKMKAVNDSEEKMIVEARKYFKSTCFSTAQVKELNTLFINDEARYNFFDLAYKFVIDPDNFQSLQSEIKDIYYQSRFKAMLRN